MGKREKLMQHPHLHPHAYARVTGKAKGRVCFVCGRIRPSTARQLLEIPRGKPTPGLSEIKQGCFRPFLMRAKTVWYRIVMMVDLGNGESGGHGYLVVMCGVYLILQHDRLNQCMRVFHSCLLLLTRLEIGADTFVERQQCVHTHLASESTFAE